ncbi:MAG: UvrD-helicase domain-containing protein, partial [Clostridia bacterium]
QLKDFFYDFSVYYMEKDKAQAVTLRERLQQIASSDTFEKLISSVSQQAIGNICALSKAEKEQPNAVATHERFKDFNNEVKEFVKDIQELCSLSYVEHQQIMSQQRIFIAKLCEITRKIIAQFDEYKSQENKLDFNDLEFYTVKLLQNSEIRAEIADKYDFVCVDEYQDINAVQEFILSSVSNGNNLFMVGDTKQSIYQFRLTDPTIFLAKLAGFESDQKLGKAKSLNKNFRSSKEVLDFVNAVFDKVMTKDFGGVDYADTARLGFGSENYHATAENSVQVAVFNKESNSEEKEKMQAGDIYSVKDDARDGEEVVEPEGLFVAEKIAQMVGVTDICCLDSDGNAYTRKAEYQDICILCQTRSDTVQRIVRVLQDVGIPVDSGNIVGDKVNHTVGLLIDFCKIVDNHMQDTPLVNVMSSVFGGFSLDELASIRDAHTDKRFFFEAVELERTGDGILSDKLKEFYKRIDYYRLLAGTMSVDELFRKMLNDIDYKLFLQSNGCEQELQQVYAFLNGLADKKYAASAQEFLSFANESEALQKVANISSSKANCVQTNTVHKSKGLEYPIVFFVGAGNEFLKSDAQGKFVMDKDSGIAIDAIDEENNAYEDNLSTTLIKAKKLKQLLEEKMRLLYVALTRAKNFLFITATVKPEKDCEFKKVVALQKAKCVFDWINYVRSIDASFAAKYMIYPQELEEKEEKQNKPVYKFAQPDNNYKDKFVDYFDRKYEFADSVSLAVKHTVTELNDMAQVDGKNVAIFGESNLERNVVTEEHNQEKDTLILDENNQEKSVVISGENNLDNTTAEENGFVATSSDDGTAYHRVLELIPFDCLTVEEITEEMRNFVTNGDLMQSQFDKVKPQIILQCLQSEILTLARENNHLREKEFMLYAPAKDIIQGSQVQDKILLQGKVDLIILGEKNTLVDFKFSSKSKEYITQKYSKQLQLYAFAIEKCMNITIDRKVIYVIGKDWTIEM